MINRVLLEVWCTKNWEHNGNNAKPFPEFCKNQGEFASYACLFHHCPFVDFTSCENTLCYINEKSEMEHGILFGGDMGDEHDSAEIELWKKMSVDAVERTYEKYMKETKTA